jgi:hypothetical protein
LLKRARASEARQFVAAGKNPIAEKRQAKKAEAARAQGCRMSLM